MGDTATTRLKIMSRAAPAPVAWRGPLLDSRAVHFAGTPMTSMTQPPLRAASALLAALLGLAANGASATAAPDGRWTGSVTPYLWGLGLSGTVRPLANGPTLTVDRSLSDILDNLDAAGFITGLARRDDWVLAGDLTFSRSTMEGRIGPPNLPPALRPQATARERQLTISAMVGRTISEGQDSRVDLLAGIRAWRLRAEISVPATRIDVRSTTTIVDPVVGVHWEGPIGERWSAMAYGDVGGFGVDSKFTWQVVAAAKRPVGQSSQLSFGWRYLAVDYEEDGRRLDLAFAGPFVGWTWNFD